MCVENNCNLFHCNLLIDFVNICVTIDHVKKKNMETRKSINKYIYLIILVLLSSCGIEKEKSEDNRVSYNNSILQYYETTADIYCLIKVKENNKSHFALISLLDLKNIISNDIRKIDDELLIAKLFLEWNKELVINEDNKYIVDIYTPCTREGMWASRGKSKYLEHYVVDNYIIENIPKDEVIAVICRLIQWKYMVYIDSWGLCVTRK